MSNNHKYILLTCLFTLQMGCASNGFNRGELKEQVAVTKPEFNDQEIKNAFSKKTNLPKDCKVAVYFKPPPLGKNQSKPDWRWTENDRLVFSEIASELKKEGVVSDVFPIVNSLVSDDDLKSLRLAAAKHQADALLIISGAGETDRYINNLGWTYALMLPALFIPGSEAEATKNSTYIAAFGKSDKELINDAKTESLALLKVEFSKMIKGTKLQ